MVMMMVCLDDNGGIERQTIWGVQFSGYDDYYKHYVSRSNIEEQQKTKAKDIRRIKETKSKTFVLRILKNNYIGLKSSKRWRKATTGKQQHLEVNFHKCSKRILGENKWLLH